MNSGELAVLEALAQSPKGQLSISDIVRLLKSLRGAAYYKNVYGTVKKLKAEGVVGIKSAGRTSLVSLNFSNPDTISALSIMEIEKKRAFIKEERGEADLVRALESLGGGSIVLIKPRENLKLNIVEILYITGEGGISNVLTEAKKIGKIHNCRICPLVLTKNEFKKLLENGVNHSETKASVQPAPQVQNINTTE